MYYLLISKAQIHWLDFGVWFSFLGILIMIFAIVIRKASKKDLTKLEKDMESKVQNLERRNENDHTNLRIIITEHFDTRIEDLKEFMIQLVKKK